MKSLGSIALVLIGACATAGSGDDTVGPIDARTDAARIDAVGVTDAPDVDAANIDAANIDAASIDAASIDGAGIDAPTPSPSGRR